MKDKLIIGLSGKKRSGKDTVARFIQEVDRDVRVVSFAGALKKIACTALNLPDGWFDDDDSKESLYKVGSKKRLTGRKFLQLLGTECFRNNISEDFWVWTLMDQIEKGDPGVYVITDMRFPNEYDAVKKVGIVVRVKRDLESVDNHSSETALDNFKFDYIFNNIGTLEELREKVVLWYIDLIHKHYVS